jgi:hypothetical protein
VGPAAVLASLEDSGGDECAQVVAHRRLADAERLDEVTHAQFAVGAQEADDAESYGVGHRLEGRRQLGGGGVVEGSAARRCTTAGQRFHIGFHIDILTYIDEYGKVDRTSITIDTKQQSTGGVQT